MGDVYLIYFDVTTSEKLRGLICCNARASWNCILHNIICGFALRVGSAMLKLTQNTGPTKCKSQTSRFKYNHIVL